MSDKTCVQFEQYVHQVYDERLQQLDKEIESACTTAKEQILSVTKGEIELFTRNAQSRFNNDRAEQVAQAKLHADTMVAQHLNKLESQAYKLFLEKLGVSKNRDALFTKLLSEIKTMVKKDGVLLKDCTLHAWDKVSLANVKCDLKNPIVKAETETTVYEYSLVEWFKKEFKREARK